MYFYQYNFRLQDYENQDSVTYPTGATPNDYDSTTDAPPAYKSLMLKAGQVFSHNYILE